MNLVPRQENGDIQWHIVAIASAFAVSALCGAVWLGQLTNQIAVNTIRLTRMETQIETVMGHNSDTLQWERGIERRLDKLEK